MRSDKRAQFEGNWGALGIITFSFFVDIVPPIRDTTQAETDGRRQICMDFVWMRHRTCTDCSANTTDTNVNRYNASFHLFSLSLKRKFHYSSAKAPARVRDIVSLPPLR